VRNAEGWAWGTILLSSFSVPQESKVQACFDAHRGKCHGPDAAKGDFRIDTLS
jgi:hypothetical protein